MYMNLTSSKKFLESKGFSNLELIELTDGSVWGTRFPDGSEETYELWVNPELNNVELWVNGETPDGDTYTSYRSWRV